MLTKSGLEGAHADHGDNDWQPDPGATAPGCPEQEEGEHGVDDDAAQEDRALERLIPGSHCGCGGGKGEDAGGVQADKRGIVPFAVVIGTCIVAVQQVKTKESCEREDVIRPVAQTNEVSFSRPQHPLSLIHVSNRLPSYTAPDQDNQSHSDNRAHRQNAHVVDPTHRVSVDRRVLRRRQGHPHT